MTVNLGQGVGIASSGDLEQCPNWVHFRYNRQAMPPQSDWWNVQVCIIFGMSTSSEILLGKEMAPQLDWWHVQMIRQNMSSACTLFFSPFFVPIFFFVYKLIFQYIYNFVQKIREIKKGFKNY